jgi:hypothetical protein
MTARDDLLDTIVWFADDWAKPRGRRDTILSDVEAALAKYAAEIWDESAEETAEWMSNNPSPSGIPHDPPTNPHRS